MPTKTQQRAYDLSQRLPWGGQALATQLFFTELNTDYADPPLSTRNGPTGWCTRSAV